MKNARKFANATPNIAKHTSALFVMCMRCGLHLTRYKISDRARERAWPQAGRTDYMNYASERGAVRCIAWLGLGVPSCPDECEDMSRHSPSELLTIADASSANDADTVLRQR